MPIFPKLNQATQLQIKGLRRTVILMSSAPIVRTSVAKKEKGNSSEEQGAVPAKWGSVLATSSSKKRVNLTTLSCKSKELRKN